MSYICPYCNKEIDFVGYEERSGIDVEDDGGIDLSYIGAGDIWDSRYFCPRCEHTLTVETGTDEGDLYIV